MKHFLAVMAFLLLAGQAFALDANLVWDASHRCFRPKGESGGQCGLTWHIGQHNFSAAAGAAAVPPPAKDAGTGLDEQMAMDQQQVDSLRKNSNVENVRAALAVSETQVGETTPQDQK